MNIFELFAKVFSIISDQKGGVFQNAPTADYIFEKREGVVHRPSFPFSI
jgi:hypothetical protein